MQSSANLLVPYLDNTVKFLSKLDKSEKNDLEKMATVMGFVIHMDMEKFSKTEKCECYEKILHFMNNIKLDTDHKNRIVVGVAKKYREHFIENFTADDEIHLRVKANTYILKSAHKLTNFSDSELQYAAEVAYDSFVLAASKPEAEAEISKVRAGALAAHFFNLIYPLNKENLIKKRHLCFELSKHNKKLKHIYNSDIAFIQKRLDEKISEQEEKMLQHDILIRKINHTCMLNIYEYHNSDKERKQKEFKSIKKEYENLVKHFFELKLVNSDDLVGLRSLIYQQIGELFDVNAIFSNEINVEEAILFLRLIMPLKKTLETFQVNYNLEFLLKVLEAKEDERLSLINSFSDKVFACERSDSDELRDSVWSQVISLDLISSLWKPEKSDPTRFKQLAMIYYLRSQCPHSLYSFGGLDSSLTKCLKYNSALQALSFKMNEENLPEDNELFLHILQSFIKDCGSLIDDMPHLFRLVINNLNELKISNAKIKEIVNMIVGVLLSASSDEINSYMQFHSALFTLLNDNEELKSKCGEFIIWLKYKGIENGEAFRLTCGTFIALLEEKNLKSNLPIMLTEYRTAYEECANQFKDTLDSYEFSFICNWIIKNLNPLGAENNSSVQELLFLANFRFIQLNKLSDQSLDYVRSIFKKEKKLTTIQILLLAKCYANEGLKVDSQNSADETRLIEIAQEVYALIPYDQLPREHKNLLDECVRFMSDHKAKEIAKEVAAIRIFLAQFDYLFSCDKDKIPLCGDVIYSEAFARELKNYLLKGLKKLNRFLPRVTLESELKEIKQEFLEKQISAVVLEEKLKKIINLALARQAESKMILKPESAAQVSERAFFNALSEIYQILDTCRQFLKDIRDSPEETAKHKEYLEKYDNLKKKGFKHEGVLAECNDLMSKCDNLATKLEDKSKDKKESKSKESKWIQPKKPANESSKEEKKKQKEKDPNEKKSQKQTTLSVVAALRATPPRESKQATPERENEVMQAETKDVFLAYTVNRLSNVVAIYNQIQQIRTSDKKTLAQEFKEEILKYSLIYNIARICVYYILHYRETRNVQEKKLFAKLKELRTMLMHQGAMELLQKDIVDLIPQFLRDFADEFKGQREFDRVNEIKESFAGKIQSEKEPLQKLLQNLHEKDEFTTGINMRRVLLKLITYVIPTVKRISTPFIDFVKENDIDSNMSAIKKNFTSHIQALKLLLAICGEYYDENAFDIALSRAGSKREELIQLRQIILDCQRDKFRNKVAHDKDDGDAKTILALCPLFQKINCDAQFNNVSKFFVEDKKEEENAAALKSKQLPKPRG